MFTMEQINNRIEYLQSISPNGSTQIFAEFKEALNNYLTRDEEFCLQVNKTLDKIIAFEFHHRIKYENQELLDQWQDVSYRFEKPLGFDNVRELFKLDAVFEEIMTISDRIFLQAFYSVQSNSDGKNGSSEWRNTYIDKWISELTTALTNELEYLKEIMRRCANRSYAAEWAILFEELGKCTNRQKVRSLAKNIFYTRGYGWLIETFNLDTVYRASYMSELPDWIDESDTTTIITTNN
ncbi:MAG: hypothetical protein IJ728_07465 [Selenomonadaceae bacterium]|nr:hypothetical protein [Selenomonadaceae bacterium]